MSTRNHHVPPPPPPPPKGAPPKPKKMVAKTAAAISKESTTDNSDNRSTLSENAQPADSKSSIGRPSIVEQPPSERSSSTAVPIMEAIQKVIESNKQKAETLSAQKPVEATSRNYISKSNSFSSNNGLKREPTISLSSNPFDDERDSGPPSVSAHTKLSFDRPSNSEQPPPSPPEKVARPSLLPTSSPSIPKAEVIHDEEDPASQKSWISSVTSHHETYHSAGEPWNPIYHKIRLSETWLCGAVAVLIGQFILLLTVGRGNPPALPTSVLAVLLVIVFATVALILSARFLVHKSRLSNNRNIKLRGNVCSPDDEADAVPDLAVILLSLAAVLEGISFAIYTTVTAGNSQALPNDSGFYSQGTTLQTLRFASITLLMLHRVLRPANRGDPMRTVLEVTMDRQT